MDADIMFTIIAEHFLSWKPDAGFIFYTHL